MYDYLVLFAGLICAGIGGELFIRGTVGLARWAHVSAGIIGATVAAFATSSPELTVAINAALAGKPGISLGDALGSNVLNVALILGLTLLIGGLQVSRDDVKRDVPVALLAPVLIGLLAMDGTLSRIDGVILLCAFAAWLMIAIITAHRQRSAADTVLAEGNGWRTLLFCLAGLALLIAAGRLIVTGAEGIARVFGLNAFVIGAVVVAIGTSVPELATAVIAKVRGHDEIGVGAILGSNIFNGLFIIGLLVTIAPATIVWREILIALSFGIASIIVVLPGRGGFLRSWRGYVLLALYIGYLAVTLACPR